MTEYRVVLNHDQLDRTPLRQATLCIYGLLRLSDQIFVQKETRTLMGVFIIWGFNFVWKLNKWRQSNALVFVRALKFI